MIGELGFPVVTAQLESHRILKRAIVQQVSNPDPQIRHARMQEGPVSAMNLQFSA